MKTRRSLLLIFSIAFVLIFTNYSLPGVFAEQESYSNDNNDFTDTPVYRENPQLGRSTPQSELFDFDLNISYAIIAPYDFYDQLVPFSEWKTKKGVAAHIFVLEDIYDRFIGKNSAEKIQKFLKELKKYKPATEWLLLVGDSEKIPAPEIRADVDGDATWDELQDFAYSDNYYAGLDSTWDHDSDGILGETLKDYDWTPDLYVGRFPVSTKDELAVVLDKNNIYETRPPESSWFYNAILVGAVMEVKTGPNVPDNESTFEDDGYNDYKDNALKVNKKVKKLFPESYNFIEYYDYHQLESGNYNAVNDTLNHDNVVFGFNQGASIVNFVSHGYDNGNGHVEYSGDGENPLLRPFYEYQDAEKASNGYKLPFVYSSSCSSANFTEVEDTGLEKLLTAQNGGAIGLLGATVLTYRGEFRVNNTSFGNWWLNEHFYQLFNMGDHKPGRLLYRIKEDYSEHIKDKTNPYGNDINYQQMFRVNLLAYNYLGDPELSIWTRAPQELVVEFDETFQPPFWDSPFPVKVKNKYTDEPVQNARVAITGPDQFGWAVSDKSGSAELLINAVPGIRYNLTVTADDFMAFEDQFDVVAGVNMHITDQNISVEKNRLSEGESTKISLYLTNNGGITAPEVEVWFYDGQPKLGNIIDVYSFKDILPGEERHRLISWTMPGGDHQIYAVLDPDDKLMELDESDNTVSITIYENNPPYFFELPVVPVKEDVPYDNALLLSNYAWDKDASDILEFSIISSSESSCKVVIDDNNYIDITPDPNWFGECNVTLEISDSMDSAQAYLNIIVSSVNDPPVLNTVEVQPMLEEVWYEILLFGEDEDTGDRVYFETNLHEVFPELEQNTTFEFDRSSGVLNLRPTNSMVGEHTVLFRAVDEHGAVGPWQEVQFVIINENDMPIIELDKKYQAKVGQKFELDVIVHDEDKGDTMVFWDDTDLFEIDPDTGRISFTPKRGDAGTYSITISVFDGNDTVEKSFELTIENGWGGLTLYITSVVIILAVLILAAVVIVFKKRRSRRAARAGSDETGDTHEEDEQDSSDKQKDKDIKKKPVVGKTRAKPSRKRKEKSSKEKEVAPTENPEENPPDRQEDKTDNGDNIDESDD